MTEPLLTFAAGCLLQLSSTTVGGGPGAWEESTAYRITADPLCKQVTVVNPPLASLADVRAHTLTRLGKRQVDPERFLAHPRDPSGRGEVTLFVPEVRAGDEIVLQVQRIWRTPFMVWQPGLIGPHTAHLERERGVPWTTSGSSSASTGTRVQWDPPSVSDRIVVGTSMDEVLPSPPPPIPAAPPEERWQHTLRVPPGDPQVVLFPGGGSSVHMQGDLLFDPDSSSRAWVVALHPGHTELEARVTPEHAATFEERPEGLVVHLSPSEIRTQIWLSWIEPDAPTFGHVDPSGNTSIRAENGVIQWEVGAGKWWLQFVNDRPVMPNSATLLAALERRFLNATLKEPALPSHLRGRATDSNLAAELVHHVRTALVEATWPHEPTVPRPVMRVFRSGAATPVEAALALKALLAQANIDSQWALVHRASAGRGGRISLAGYTHMLLEMSVPDGSLWIDPLCHDCTAFEIRPELEGSASIGPASGPPAASQGHLQATFDPPLARWELSGSASTHLRLAWARVPVSEREAWLTHRFWPGAHVTDTSGLEQPGGSIILEMSSETGSPYDPLALPLVRTSDDTAWLPWVGARTVTRPGRCTEAEASAGPLHWHQSHDGGTVTETLGVTSRVLEGEDVRTIHRSRRSEEVSADAERVPTAHEDPQPTGTQRDRLDHP